MILLFDEKYLTWAALNEFKLSLINNGGLPQCATNLLTADITSFVDRARLISKYNALGVAHINEIE